jgi:hypothetical protein
VWLFDPMQPKMQGFCEFALNGPADVDSVVEMIDKQISTWREQLAQRKTNQ